MRGAIPYNRVKCIKNEKGVRIYGIDSLRFHVQILGASCPHPSGSPHRQMVGPDGVLPQGPFKTLYLLHGIFGNETDWVCGTRVQAWALERNLAVVIPLGKTAST